MSVGFGLSVTELVFSVTVFPQFVINVSEPSITLATSPHPLLCTKDFTIGSLSWKALSISPEQEMTLCLLSFSCLFSQGRASLCIPGCPGTDSISTPRVWAHVAIIIPPLPDRQARMAKMRTPGVLSQRETVPKPG